MKYYVRNGNRALSSAFEAAVESGMKKIVKSFFGGASGSAFKWKKKKKEKKMLKIMHVCKNLHRARAFFCANLQASCRIRDLKINFWSKWLGVFATFENKE